MQTIPKPKVPKVPKDLTLVPLGNIYTGALEQPTRLGLIPLEPKDSPDART